MDKFNKDLVMSKIIDIPDFPVEGVVFKDISPLLMDSGLMKEVTYKMAIQSNVPKYYVAMDARGFIFASMMSQLSSNGDFGGILMCRKKGKLPGDCVSESYELEYGENVLEMRKGLTEEGSDVVIVDDVLATGGTALCACHLCEKLGLKVKQVTVLMELESLGGRDVLERNGYKVVSLLKY